MDGWSDTILQNSHYLSYFDLKTPHSSPSFNNINISDYNISYPYSFSFETNFEPMYIVELMKKYEWLPYPIGALYIVLIFSLQAIMKDRQPFNLEKPLILWNLALSVFSIWGALRTIPELFYMMKNYGFTASVCITRGPLFYQNRVWGLWVWLFAVSKAFELGDTLFIILRKKKLIFLHWYHHVATLFYTWIFYPTYVSTARWFICMNYFIHSFMYTYFFLSALKIRIPKWISMLLTSCQISQMFMGLFINLWALSVLRSGNVCHVEVETLKISLFVFTTYAILFLNFFVKVYFKSNKSNKLSKHAPLETNGKLSNGLKLD